MNTETGRWSRKDGEMSPLLTSWLALGVCAGLLAAVGGLANMPPPPRPVTTTIMFLILGLLVTGMFAVLSGAGGGG